MIVAAPTYDWGTIVEVISGSSQKDQVSPVTDTCHVMSRHLQCVLLFSCHISNSSLPSSQDELEEYFREIYGLLDEIFINYAGEKKKESAEPCTMTFAEFSHFLHMTRIYHAYKDLSMIKEFVLETKRRLMEASESKREDPSEEFLNKEEVSRPHSSGMKQRRAK